jgi:hypothetical protein
MDTGVTVGAASDERQPAKAAAKKIVRGANSSDLDAWLEKVEALGELKRITRRCCSRILRVIPAIARSTTWSDATCRASA